MSGFQAFYDFWYADGGSGPFPLYGEDWIGRGVDRLMYYVNCRAFTREIQRARRLARDA